MRTHPSQPHVGVRSVVRRKPRRPPSSSCVRQQDQLKPRLEQSVAARCAAELAEVRYRAGSSDFLTLLDAQRTQLAADDALARTEAGVNVGVVTIYQSLGGWGEQDVAAALAALP